MFTLVFIAACVLSGAFGYIACTVFRTTEREKPYHEHWYNREVHERDKREK